MIKRKKQIFIISIVNPILKNPNKKKNNLMKINSNKKI